MANREHLKILKQGVQVWNHWRQENPYIEPDLHSAILKGDKLNYIDFSEAKLNRANLQNTKLEEANLQDADLRMTNLSGADLSGANLIRADLIESNLKNAILHESNLIEADLRCANLRGVDLIGAKLTAVDLSYADLFKSDLQAAFLLKAKLNNANLKSANLSMANLTMADLSGANLEGADLSGIQLVWAKLNSANLNGSRIFGISAWKLELEGTKQTNLIMTNYDEPIITVDNLEVAQFIYLLLNNEKIRHVIDTITSKVVLILGRFTKERKTVLDAIRDELRDRDYLPVVFDFDKPASRDLTETISTLAHMARFIVADITEPRSIPQELATIIPTLSVPVKPLLLKVQPVNMQCSVISESIPGCSRCIDITIRIN